MPLPNRLAALRTAAGLTVPQLAVAIGKDPTTVWRWEKCRIAIPDEQKVVLAQKFGVTVGHLMAYDDGEDVAA